MNNSGIIKSRRRFISSIESETVWLSPPGNLTLGDDEVHVWQASLREKNAGEFEKIISPDERARAGRFRFSAHSKKFIVGRGILRIILGKYLKIKPEQFEFEYNLYGKPLIGGKLRGEIKFNLSHSGDMALYAFSNRREVGIDIEAVQSFFIDEQTTAQMMTHRENEFLNMLPESSRARFFFNCWTQKEAYLKGCGKGLSFPANQIETSFSQESATVADLSKEVIWQKKGWAIRKLPSIEGYAAAIAVEDGNIKMSFWNSDFN